jgi:mannose-1-phosphate guanylyltransferase
MVVMPSDRVVLDKERFTATMRYAVEVASTGDHLVTIGIRPTRPEEGYGYTECGEPLGECGEPLAARCIAGQGETGRCESPGASAYRVRRFTEKPGLEDALEFLKHGRHLWNAGIFAWRLSAIRQALERHTAPLFEGLTTIERLLPRGQDVGVREGFLYKVREIFLAMEHTSIDYALLEKADNILVVPGDFGWDDVGTGPPLSGFMIRTRMVT